MTDTLICVGCKKKCEKSSCEVCVGWKQPFSKEPRIMCRKCCGQCVICQKVACTKSCLDWWEPDPTSIFKDFEMLYPGKACRMCEEKERFFSMKNYERDRARDEMERKRKQPDTSEELGILRREVDFIKSHLALVEARVASLEKK